MARKRKTKRQLQYARLDDLCIKLVIIRDNCTCRKCGKDLEHEQRHVHHITRRSKSARLRWDLKNLILLCKECHCWYTNDEVAGDKWFRENYPVQYAYLWTLIPKEDQFDDVMVLVPRRNCIKTWRAAGLDELEMRLKEKLLK